VLTYKIIKEYGIFSFHHPNYIPLAYSFFYMYIFPEDL